MTTSTNISSRAGDNDSARPLASVLRQKPARQADCTVHGSYTSRNIMADIWTKCPVCANEAAGKAKVAGERAE